MKLEVVKIVSAPTRGNWSQVHVFTPEDEEKLQKRGQIFAVFCLKNVAFQSEEEIASVGKEIISRFHEEYYGFLENTAFSQLKKAQEQVLKEILSEAKIEIISGAAIENVFYLGITGLGKIILSRRGKTGFILQGEEDLIKMASGFLQSGDIFILGTKNFFEIIPFSTIETALKSGSAQRAGEILTPLVLGKEDGLASALILGAKEEEEKLEESRVLVTQPEKRKEIKKTIADLFLKIKRAITQPPPEKPKKSYFTVALILLLILGVSMVFGSKERKKQEQEKKIEAVLEQVKAKKEEGEALLSLNPTRAREILKEAEVILSQIEKKKITSPQLEEVKKELKNSLDSVLKEYTVEEKLFFDLELIKKGAKGSDMVLTEEQLVFLDSQNLAVYSLGIKNKNALILAGGEQLKDCLKIATFGNRVYILGPQGVLEGKLKTQNEKLEMVVEKDKDWEEVKDLAIFAGNLYLLDKKGIWIYPASGEGFGGKKGWLKNPGDFSQAEEMIIDGAIWVIKKDVGVEKYLRGDKETFRIEGLDKPFLWPFGLYTSPDEERLYILDRGNSRIVVLDKNGQYYSQYKNPQITSAQSLVVSEKEGKIFILQAGKIYEIALK
jgi:hypothetical protein